MYDVIVWMLGQEPAWRENDSGQRAIWHAKAETARAVRQRLRPVLEWAVAMGLRNDNPCDRVLPVLGPQNDIVTATPPEALRMPQQEGSARRLPGRRPGSDPGGNGPPLW